MAVWRVWGDGREGEGEVVVEFGKQRRGEEVKGE